MHSAHNVFAEFGFDFPEGSEFVENERFARFPALIPQENGAMIGFRPSPPFQKAVDPHDHTAEFILLLGHLYTLLGDENAVPGSPFPDTA